ncbi:MAG: RnfABCDGE type electron transport complex subunit C [Candidatus Omnitrophota bacterium]
MALFGIHPLYFKELTAAKRTEKAPLPKKVIIPLIQHTGTPCTPCVSVGEKVKTGTLLGASDKFISAPVHSSISGTLSAVDRRPHPILGYAQAVEIETDGTDELDPVIKDRQNISALSPDDLRNIIKGAGIVGLGGAAFPTHVKLSPPKDKKINAFILNGTECEPYLTCDHRIMLERAPDILSGLEIILKILGINRAYIAIEKNKPDAIAAIRNRLAVSAFLPPACRQGRARQGLRFAEEHRTPLGTEPSGRGPHTEHRTPNIEVVSIKTKYPQGAEKQLIKEILNKEVPSGGLPMDIGVLVSNVATALAVYEAVKFNKPLYERVITVTGAVKEPKNLLVRLGTPVRDLIECCGGYSADAGKIIIGGPMMGVSQITDDVPVIKCTSGILVLTKKESTPPEVSACIRCARCVDACPVSLLPCTITVAAEFEKFDIAKDYNLFDCIECGACAWVCPSKRPMVHLIKYAKLQVKK